MWVEKASAMSLLFLKSSKVPRGPKDKTLITQAFCDPAPPSSPATLPTLSLEEILFSAFLTWRTCQNRLLGPTS